MEKKKCARPNDHGQFVSQVKCHWRHRSDTRLRSPMYLGCAGALAVFLLMYMSQARSCAHQEPTPIQVSTAS